ncbi:MAG: VTT domain-containing protein [Nitriliruptoraceae bacterium]|nr:VTT domain-containing protein [Nitriliruptoraceae bacterium]
MTEPTPPTTSSTGSDGAHDDGAERSTVAELAILPPEVADRWRRVGLAIVIVRFAIPLIAIPFIPYLVLNNVALLVLVRPQKEFLLVGGGQWRYLGEPNAWMLFAAYLPLGILAVSGFFLVGRAYRRALEEGEGPGWLQRAIPPRQLELGQRVLARRGPAIAVIGRLAALPPTVLAAAAGLSDIPARRYLLADLLGALVSFAITVGVGFALGRAYEEGGIWITAVGVALFGLVILLVTRWIQREAERDRGDEDPEADPEADDAAADA